ncbi:MAG: endonuclease V [Pyrinomonadaceae bacterium]
MYAGIVVLELPSLRVVEESGVVTETQFPYVPGLLSFGSRRQFWRRGRSLILRPDVVFLDGHGLAHPRRVGIASHIGLLLNRPTIGCGKSVLVGKYEEPAPERGSWSAMVDRGEIVGAALRTKNNVNPVFVSPGHLIDIEGSIDLALAYDGGYRVPEPTRRAHLLVNQLRKEKM